MHLCCVCASEWTVDLRAPGSSAQSLSVSFAGTWVKQANGVPPCIRSAVAFSKGYLLVIGGLKDDLSTSLNKAWRATHTKLIGIDQISQWTARTNVPYKAADASVVVLPSGKVILFGGSEYVDSGDTLYDYVYFTTDFACENKGLTCVPLSLVPLVFHSAL